MFLDAVVAQIVRGGQAVGPAADDDHVIRALELGLAAPHAALAEDVKHRRSPPPAGRRRPPGATEVPAGVGDDPPHVLPGGPPEQEQVALLVPHDQARLAADRARAQRVHRRDLRSEVQGAEARERLARKRAHERDRGEVGRDVQDVEALGAVDLRALADDQRPGLGEPAPPGVVPAHRGAERQLPRCRRRRRWPPTGPGA